MKNAWMQQHRRLLLLGLPLSFLIICLIVYLLSGRYVSTDDAYVQAAKATITTNVSGQVATIYVHDNQPVKKGSPLFSLDDRPYQMAVKSAMAQLVSAQLHVEALKSSYQQQMASVREAEQTNRYQQQEFDRQTKLAASGISSQMQLNEATNTLQIAQQKLNAAKQQIGGALANLNNNADIAIADHPLVQQAQANLDEANLNLSYTVITAPFDGIVTKVEYLQPGNYIHQGEAVFAVISDQDIWVEANFRETDITYMRPGQPVSIHVDAYPNKKFAGVVVSLSPGTGSTFSLLPPENATGNWVKIVQRLPVRISIDNSDDPAMLSAGLSANVSVDTKHKRFTSADKHK